MCSVFFLKDSLSSLKELHTANVGNVLEREKRLFSVVVSSTFGAVLCSSF